MLTSFSIRSLFCILIFFSLLAHSELTENLKEKDAQPISSPYFACSGPRPPLLRNTNTDRKQRRKANKAPRDFYSELQKRIEVRSVDNIEKSKELYDCFKIPRVESEGPKCTQVRSLFFPKDEQEAQESLLLKIKEARVHLALASEHASDYLTPNWSLDPKGYKGTPWNPTSLEEYQLAQEHLNRYRDQFMESNNLSLSQFNCLLPAKTRHQQRSQLPYRYKMGKQGEVGHVACNKTMTEERTEVLRRALKNDLQVVRRQHLEFYRYIVGQYPIINFLSSASPSANEVFLGAKKMMEHAPKELQLIQEAGEKIKIQRFPDSVRDLIKYRGIVEELLVEHPEYCGIASREFNNSNNRELMVTGLSIAPLMAAAIFAPPKLAVGYALADSLGWAGHSYWKFEREKQAAYSVPINDGSLRASQASVDKAHLNLQAHIAFIPVEIAAVGGISIGLRRARRAIKNSK